MSLVSYLHVRCDDPLPELRHEPRKVMLIAEEAAGDQRQAEICEWLVVSGCLYFVAWGEACEAWHDTMDDRNISDFEGRDIPDGRFVFTSWHAGQPLSEAMWFAAECAEHPAAELEQTLIVHVAPSDRGDELVRLYRSASSTPR